jgi:hypothetical protein
VAQVAAEVRIFAEAKRFIGMAAQICFDKGLLASQ